MTITAHHPVPIQIDGDTFGTTPVEVDAGTGEVRLIVPRLHPVAATRRVNLSLIEILGTSEC